MKPRDRLVWPVRIASMLVASAAGLALTTSLYPVLHQRPVSPLAGGFSVLFNLGWGLALIAPGLLGWMPNEDASNGRDALSGRWRVGLLLGGLVAVAVTGAFLALVGESSPDP